MIKSKFYTDSAYSPCHFSGTLPLNKFSGLNSNDLNEKFSFAIETLIND